MNLKPKKKTLIKVLFLKASEKNVYTSFVISDVDV